MKQKFFKDFLKIYIQIKLMMFDDFWGDYNGFSNGYSPKNATKYFPFTAVDHLLFVQFN